MKKIIKLSFLILVALSVITSCKKEGTLNADLSSLDRDVISNTALDTWLDQNYLTPYNIQVKYRWDAFEADLDKTLVPPKESLVQPTMETILAIWIKTYEKVGGADFMKINTPKQFYLVGSPSYNGDGTITLGTAEGGKKIVLYIINNFNKSNTANTTEMIHVIEHEFTHILNQKVPYPVAFNLITKSDYTANWNIYNQATARSLGFITQYSRASSLEDFAEMTSEMLILGKTQYDAIVNALAADPKAKLRQKELYVVQYFKTAFNIDFYALQAEVSAAIDRNAPPLYTVLGTGKTYNNFTSTPSTTNALTPQSTSFLALWNAAVTKVTALGYTLSSYQFVFNAGTSVTLRYTITKGTTSYLCDADLNMVADANGLVTFSMISPQGAGTAYNNFAFISTAVSGVTNYITGNQFKVDYPSINLVPSKGLPGVAGAFYKASDPTSYMIGILNYY